MSKLDLFGCNRGGTGILKQLPDEVVDLYDMDAILADPKAGRAENLARLWCHRFIFAEPRALCMTAQEALASYSGDDDTLLLALDSVVDMGEVLTARRPHQSAIFQLLGQGPGRGTRTAIQGTLVPGDEDSSRRTLLLLATLEQMSQEASSRVLTTDPISGSVLKPMRDLVTRQTIRHLLEQQQDPWGLSGSPLSIAFGPTLYPLLPVAGHSQDRYRHRTALAEESSAGVPQQYWVEGPRGRSIVVAVVVSTTSSIDFMTVAQSTTGKRRVVGVTTFAPAPSQQELIVRPAVFTD